jgi:XTP/dITP diphosphohydrolase
MKLIFATHNKHKVEEIQSICPTEIQLVSLAELSYHQEIPETQDTIEGNSLQKANHVFDVFKLPCFSEDTGLEVEALNGAPGVNTARYAGVKASFEDNIDKLLGALDSEENRNARFVTVITLMDADGKNHQFKGVCEGEILQARCGEKGFGYDPIFKPTGSNKAFAEMTLAEKNMFSHRAKAFAKFVEYLSVAR